MAAFLAVGLAVGCQKEGPAEEPVFPVNPNPPAEKALEPAVCTNNVVAHRCGAKEINAPDNSLQALKYAMKLGCLAAECDMYYTKDNNVIIHHGSDGLVNGLHPSKSTLAEIRAKGKLSNGEPIPTLEDFLDVVCVTGNCTKLWIETKNITNSGLSSTEQQQAMVNAVNRAIEIINEKKANNFVEFNGTGSASRFKVIAPIATAAGFKISYATGDVTYSSTILNSRGAKWANYDVTQLDAKLFPEIVADYEKNSVELSVYNIDTPALRSMVLPYKSKLKGILTNYPNAMINALK